HGLLPWSNLKIALRIRNPAARSSQLQVYENTCLPIGSEAPTQTSNDLPRALTEFGQQAEVSPNRRPVLGVAINQSAIALLRLFGRRLLKLDGENLVGL